MCIHVQATTRADACRAQAQPQGKHCPCCLRPQDTRCRARARCLNLSLSLCLHVFTCLYLSCPPFFCFCLSFLSLVPFSLYYIRAYPCSHSLSLLLLSDLELARKELRQERRAHTDDVKRLESEQRDMQRAHMLSTRELETAMTQAQAKHQYADALLLSLYICIFVFLCFLCYCLTGSLFSYVHFDWFYILFRLSCFFLLLILLFVSGASKRKCLKRTITFKTSTTPCFVCSLMMKLCDMPHTCRLEAVKENVTVLKTQLDDAIKSLDTGRQQEIKVRVALRRAPLALFLCLCVLAFFVSPFHIAPPMMSTVITLRHLTSSYVILRHRRPRLRRRLGRQLRALPLLLLLLGDDPASSHPWTRPSARCSPP